MIVCQLPLFLIFSIFPPIISSKTTAGIPYKIQGTVTFPNGTSIFADHELPAKPENLDEKLLFRGLFQLAGQISMGPILLGETQKSQTIRGSVHLPNGTSLQAHRNILSVGQKSSSSSISAEHDNLYLRNGSIGAHVFTISETDHFRAEKSPMGQIKVNVDNNTPKGNVKGLNSYYLENERLGAFVYTEGAEQEPRLASSQSGIIESCRFSFTQAAGKRGQYWLLRSKPCGNLPRLTTKLPEGTNLHFYGVPVLVDL